MSKIIQWEKCEMTKVASLRFVMAVPRENYIICTCMKPTLQKAEECDLLRICITFNLPLYLEAIYY